MKTSFRIVKKEAYQQLILDNQKLLKEVQRQAEEIEQVREKEKERADLLIDAQKDIMMKTVQKFQRSESLFIEKIIALEKELALMKESQQAGIN